MTLLYLDIDGFRLPARLLDSITVACRLWDWPIEAVRIDRTRNGWHVVIGVKRRLSPVTIVAAQAILGSHDRREMWNLLRAMNLTRVPRFWRSRWNVLYSSHRKPVRVGSGNRRRATFPRSVA